MEIRVCYTAQQLTELQEQICHVYLSYVYILISEGLVLPMISLISGLVIGRYNEFIA